MALVNPVVQAPPAASSFVAVEIKQNFRLEIIP